MNEPVSGRTYDFAASTQSAKDHESYLSQNGRNRPATIADLPTPPSGRSGWPWTYASATHQVTPGENCQRITIITPSFNQGIFIEETIRSVLLQGYPDLEYIVIDGGSTDGTVDILKKYSPWISHWESKPDRGQSHAINKGLARATGEWFNWLNSDDYLQPGALATLAQNAASHPEARLIAGQLNVLRDGQVLRNYGIKLTGNTADDIVNHRTAQPAMFYRTSFVGRVNESLHFAMDYELWVRLLAIDGGGKTICRIESTLATFREHAASKTGSQSERFETDERAVLRTLAIAIMAHPSFVDALSPAGVNSVPATILPLTPHEISARELWRAVVPRYLLGELHQKIKYTGLLHNLSLIRLCARTAPLRTASVIAKTWVKTRILRRHA